MKRTIERQNKLIHTTKRRNQNKKWVWEYQVNDPTKDYKVHNDRKDLEKED